jgi:ribonuclease P protein component
MLYNLEGTGPHPVAVAISVPKRLFKRAVDRNLLKRRMKEAYRLNKPALYDLARNKEVKINMVLLYNHREITSYSTIESAIKQGMLKLGGSLE